MQLSLVVVPWVNQHNNHLTWECRAAFSQSDNVGARHAKVFSRLFGFSAYSDYQIGEMGTHSYGRDGLQSSSAKVQKEDINKSVNHYSLPALE